MDDEQQYQDFLKDLLQGKDLDLPNDLEYQQFLNDLLDEKDFDLPMDIQLQTYDVKEMAKTLSQMIYDPDSAYGVSFKKSFKKMGYTEYGIEKTVQIHEFLRLAVSQLDKNQIRQMLNILHKIELEYLIIGIDTKKKRKDLVKTDKRNLIEMLINQLNYI
jgi:hypothetical protein